jgi:hypothetical protein
MRKASICVLILIAALLAVLIAGAAMAADQPPAPVATPACTALKQFRSEAAIVGTKTMVLGGDQSNLAAVITDTLSNVGAPAVMIAKDYLIVAHGDGLLIYPIIAGAICSRPHAELDSVAAHALMDKLLAALLRSQA